MRRVSLCVIALYLFMQPARAEDTTTEEDPSWYEEAMIDAFWWLVDKLVKAGMKLLDLTTSAAAALKPDGMNDAMSSALAILAQINNWIPLSWGASVLIGYFGMWLLLLVLRWVIKLIPTIG